MLGRDFHHKLRKTHQRIPVPNLFSYFKGQHINDIHRNFVRKSNSSQKHICDKCGFLATTAYQLERHMGSDICMRGRVTYKCDKEGCEFQSNWKVSLQLHHRTVHSKIACPICGKIISEFHMKTHIATYHTEDKNKPFVCKVCGKGFGRKKEFKEHMNIHTGERPYKCEHCEKAYSSSGNLRMHRRTVHLGYKRRK